MNVELGVRPECFMSGQKYMSYLWLGHCVLNPGDYYDGLTAFHQDETIAEVGLQKFNELIQDTPEKLLLQQLGSVVASAEIEFGVTLPLDAKQRRRLQVYLAGEVTTKGRDYAEQNGLFDDFPGLKNVNSPLRDSYIVDGLMRYKKSGKLSQALLGHATYDRLMPGYELPTENSSELALSTVPERMATVLVLKDVVRRRRNR